MLLAELNKIVDLENNIKQRQRELSELYMTRAKLLGQKEAASNEDRIPASDNDFAVHTLYEELAANWLKQRIKIPTLGVFKSRLSKTHRVIAELEAAAPECIGRFQVIIVPPSRRLPLSVTNLDSPRQRLAQKIHSPHITPHNSDRNQSMKATARRTWGVLVVLASNEGIYQGQPDNILERKKYMVGKHDTRALGIIEYTALTMSVPFFIDTATNTMLLKNVAVGSIVPVAHFWQDRYDFDIDSSRICGLFGDDRYRPAVEIFA